MAKKRSCTGVVASLSAAAIVSALVATGCGSDWSPTSISRAVAPDYEQHQWAFAASNGSLLVPPGEEALLTGVVFGQNLHLRLAFVGPAMTSATIRLKYYTSLSDFENDTNGRFVGASGADWMFDDGCSPGQWCDHGNALPSAITSDHHPAPGYAFEQEGPLTWNPPTPSTGDENNFHLRYVGTSTQAQDYRFRYVVDGAVMPFSNMHYNASKPAMVRTSPCTSLFADDFESYPVGTFPYSGGWELPYAGDGNEFVDNTYVVSGTKSLHLSSQSCWTAHAYHPVTNMPTSRVVVKANVRVAQWNPNDPRCEVTLAAFGPWNPSVGTWGTFYGNVEFASDGYIYAVKTYHTKVPLMPFSAATWYAVTIDSDLVRRTFDVYVDGVLHGSNVDILDAGMPTGLDLQGGFASTAWYDDANVLQP